MTNENEFDYVDMTDEELAAHSLNEAVTHAQTTLRMAENCYQKFGKQLLTQTQKAYFQKLASGILPTDEEQAAMDNEQITRDMQAVKQARELNKRLAARLGEAYTPSFFFKIEPIQALIKRNGENNKNRRKTDGER